MTQARTPRVTVGLPVYNGERFLSDAIEGILDQDFEDFELIISDNASTDATGDIARRYADKDARIRYILNDRNIGASPNYNQLVGMARGEYFKWQAHDDVCAPAFLGRCVAALDADPGVVLAFPRAAEIDEDGEVIRVWPSLLYATEEAPSARARSTLRFPSPCFESFGLTRLAVLRGTTMIGPFTSSDRVLFLELALRGRFHEVDERLLLHRQHASRSVHRFRNDRERNAWFDPNRPTTLSSPRWRLMREYVRAIVTAPIPAGEKARALACIPPWARTHGRTLGREAVVRVVDTVNLRRAMPVGPGRAS